jgi:FdhE protein
VTRRAAPDAGQDALQARLAAVARETPAAAEAAAVLGALLTALREATVGVVPPEFPPAEARARLGRGSHLLEGHDLALDAEAAQKLLIALARALATAVPTPAAQRLRDTLERGGVDVAALLPHTAAGAREPVAAAARDRGLDAGLLWALAQAVLRPALCACSAALAPLAEGVPWEHAHCPVCGAPATLAELRADGGRHLRCCRCGADWRVRRLLCPWCGNEDHGTLRTLYEEGCRATRRVEACDRCGRYLKVVAAALPASPVGLLVEDLATLRLDGIARGRGYRPGP